MHSLCYAKGFLEKKKITSMSRKEMNESTADPQMEPQMCAANLSQYIILSWAFIINYKA